jgi:hypothetical protein
MIDIKESPAKKSRVMHAICLALVAVWFFSLGVANTALADTSYYNYTPDHPYYAANQGSTNFCWIAAASNVLAYGGWGPPNSQAIFDEIASNFPNQAGYMYQAYDWYFTTHYPQANVSNYLKPFVGFNELEQAINDHDGVDMAVYFLGGASGHALSVWGYDLNDQGIMDAVWVTNSLGDPTLTRLSVWQDGGYERIAWENSFIGWLDVLEMKPAAPEDQHSTVPEPFIGWLVGVGIMGVVGLKTKFAN